MLLKLKEKLFPIMVIFIILFLVIEYNKNKINPDYESYEVAYGSSYLRFEPLYNFFSNFAFNSGLSFESFHFLVLIFELLIFLYIIALLPNAFTWIIIPTVFIFAYTFGVQIRYGVAVLLLIAGLLEKNIIIKFLYFTIAVGFHYFSLLIIFIYFISRIINIAKINVLIIITIEIILYIISPSIINSVEYFIPFIGYEEYIGSEFLESKSLISIFYTFVVANFIFILSKDRNNFLFNFYFYIIIIFFLLSSLAVISGRLQVFSFIFQALLCAQLLKSNLLTTKKLVFISFLFYLQLLFIIK